MVVGHVPFPAIIHYSIKEFADQKPTEVESTFPHADNGDLLTQFYPYRVLMSDAWEKGELPLWNPYYLGGVSFIGNPHTALFYPFNIFYYFFSTASAWSITHFIRTLFAGIFTAIFINALGGTLLGAIIGAIIFSYSGFLTGYNGMPQADAALWTPLILYFLLQLYRDTSIKYLLALGLVLVCPVLAGDIGMLLMHTVIYSFFIVYLLLEKQSDTTSYHRLRYCFSLGAAGLLAFALGAVQILPTHEWVPSIFWLYQYPHSSLWSIVSLVSRDINHNPNMVGLHMHPACAYLTMATFVLAPLSFFYSNKRAAIFFSFAAVFAFTAATGIGPAGWLYDTLPFIKNLKHDRMFSIIDYSLAIAAGLGISAVQSTVYENKNNIKLCCAAIAGALIALLLIILVAFNAAFDVSFVASTSFTIFLLGGTLVVVLLRIRGVLRQKIFAIAIAFLVSVDALSFATIGSQYLNGDQIFPDNVKIFNFLQQLLSGKLDRFVGLSPTINNLNIPYHVASAGGYDINDASAYTFMNGPGQAVPGNITFTAQSVATSHDRRLDMLSVRYLMGDESESNIKYLLEQPERFNVINKINGMVFFENINALPAAYAVPNSSVVRVPLKDQLKEVVAPNFNPERTVIVDSASSFLPTRADEIQDSAPLRPIEWLKYSQNSFVLSTNQEKDHVIVISQIYDPGWKVLIDEIPTPLLKVNYALSGVTVPAGSHVISFRYYPDSYKTGKWISFSALFFIIIIFGISSMRKKAPRGTVTP